MKMNVRLFATLKESAGASQVSLEIVEPATVSNLIDELFHQYPAIQPLMQTILVSVNQEYADRTQTIYPGDEIVLFPPVSGG